MKRANRQMKVIIMVCTKKILFRTNWAILGPKMAHPHNSGLALRIFLKFCRMKGANRQMKLMLMIFFKKNFVEQLGKSYSATSTFKCWGSTAAILVIFFIILCYYMKLCHRRILLKSLLLIKCFVTKFYLHQNT